MESVCAYRKLLRAVRKHVTNDPSKSSFRNYISQEFRKRIDQNADKDTVKKNLQLAEDYASLLSSVHHHKVLPKLFCDKILV
jgi:ribosomal protein S20